jgi:hypothetical protein
MTLVDAGERSWDHLSLASGGFVEEMASAKEIMIGGQKLWEFRYVATFTLLSSGHTRCE